VGYGGRKTGRFNYIAQQTLRGWQYFVSKEQVEGSITSICICPQEISCFTGRRLPRARTKPHDATAADFHSTSSKLSSESQSMQAQDER